MTNTLATRPVAADTQAEADAIVAELNGGAEGPYFAYYSRTHVVPFRIAKLPEVGEEVSKGFNGDYYPEGEIVRITKNANLVVTSTGARFRRRKDAPASWKEEGGCFSMVAGHHNERNPHL